MSAAYFAKHATTKEVCSSVTPSPRQQKAESEKASKSKSHPTRRRKYESSHSQVKMAEKVAAPEPSDSGNVLVQILLEIVNSPFNIALVGLIVVLVYKIWKSRQPSSAASSHAPEPELPKLRKDFTVEEMRDFTGESGDGRILIAVNGKVFDVSKGRRFYGPGSIAVLSF